jgi:hypothetical protein
MLSVNHQAGKADAKLLSILKKDKFTSIIPKLLSFHKEKLQ